ncbi:kinase-like domain-containing protein [Schizothecium vesticola]|uniref:Kinase-like domain-containing protein n=1 Tax=Schizothecium vesticola TaxID=314040 RepID=A0AA40K9G2_9PEZI|nr:kinase-like domain-containing protein [Schizothecium vesticola]
MSRSITDSRPEFATLVLTSTPLLSASTALKQHAWTLRITRSTKSLGLLTTFVVVSHFCLQLCSHFLPVSVPVRPLPLESHTSQQTFLSQHSLNHPCTTPEMSPSGAANAKNWSCTGARPTQAYAAARDSNSPITTTPTFFLLPPPPPLLLLPPPTSPISIATGCFSFPLALSPSPIVTLRHSTNPPHPTTPAPAHLPHRDQTPRRIPRPPRQFHMSSATQPAETPAPASADTAHASAAGGLGHLAMARLLSGNAVLLGRLSSYTIGKALHREADEGAVYPARNLSGDKCIVKSIRGHWRLRNEADVLRRYQPETPILRPLIDDIHDPADPPSIALRYLDSDALTESDKKRLSRPEIKQDGMVHTDVKLDNIFVNHGTGDNPRFSDIQLGDCGGVVSQESSFAKDGHMIGAAFTRSPEATLQLPWGTATDIWSFGTAMLSLVFGGGYHLFNPKIDNVIRSLPESYQDFKEEETMTIVNFINTQGPPPKLFHRVGSREVPPADTDFLLKILKLDPRDRPTAEERLADVWFTEESRDTRDPLPGQEPEPGAYAVFDGTGVSELEF